MATKEEKRSNLFMFLAAVGLITSVIAGVVIYKYSTIGKSSASNVSTGSGAPSGPHFNLNIIGVPKGKTADMTGSQGHKIFVPLMGNCKISLAPGVFQVLDANCTDGKASFQLPNPDVNNTGTSTYSVWARALGKPGGKSTMTTCAYDVDGIEWCSVTPLMSIRNTGKSTFTDVTRNLLYVYVDLDGNGVPERYNLFDDALWGYFWTYDNSGLKLLQLRFYQIGSTVP